MRKISEGAVSPVPGETALPTETSGPPRDGGMEGERNLDEESRMFRGLLDGRSGDGKDEAPGGKTAAAAGGAPTAPVPPDAQKPAENPAPAGGNVPLPGGPAVPEPGEIPAGPAGKGGDPRGPVSVVTVADRGTPAAGAGRDGAPPEVRRRNGAARPPAPGPPEAGTMGNPPKRDVPPDGAKGGQGLSGAARTPEARGRAEPPDRREGPKREAGGKGGSLPREETALRPEGREMVPPATGEAILRFFEGPFPGRPPAGEAAGSLSEAAREIADRILVTGRSGGGKEEVRIFLKDRVLAGTEVRISREGGGIRLEIHAASADSHAFLSGRTDDLALALKDRVGENVTVDLRYSGSGREEGDGRSRQRRSAYDGREE